MRNCGVGSGVGCSNIPSCFVICYCVGGNCVCWDVLFIQ